MANTKIQLKRTSTTGRTPNTTSSGNSQYINTGELALNLTDRKLFSSDGTNPAFEIGSNLNSLSVATTINAASHTVGSSFIANTTALVHTGFANVTASVNSALLTVGTNFIANTTGAYHTGLVNAASHTVGSSFIANTTGAYHTGLVNAASHTVGSSFIANTTALVHTGIANVTTSVNSALLTVGTNFIANTTGAYHTGTVNAASHTVGSSFIANTTALVHTGFANVTTSVNSALLTVGTNFIANTTGAYHTGLVNAASHTVGSGFIANTTVLNSNTNVNLTVNNKKLSFATVNASSNVYFIQQSDDNFVLYSTNTSYGARAIWGIVANSITSNFNISVRSSHNGGLTIPAGVTLLDSTGSQGTAGQALLSNGTSNVYWGAVTAGAAGSNSQVQFNNSGLAGASAGFTFNNTTNTLAVANALTVSLVSANLSAGYANVTGQVNTATLYVTTSANVGGTLGVASLLTASGGLAVTGIANVSSNLNVTGAANALSTFGVNGLLTACSGLIVTGTANVSSNLNVTGTANVSNNLNVIGQIQLGTFGTTNGVLISNTGITVGNLSHSTTQTRSQFVIITDTVRANLSSTALTIGNSTGTAAPSINLANSTGNTTVNAIAIGSSWGLSSNASGIYHTGTINAASYTVGTTFTANATLVNAAAINVVNQTNTATLFVTTSANVGTALTISATALTVAPNTNIGSGKLFVDTVNGGATVGIGTITPLSAAGYGQLSLNGTTGSVISQQISGVEQFRIQSYNLVTTINQITALPLAFHTTNTERMRIDPNGNVAIGTAFPIGRKLVVAGDVSISSGLDVTGTTNTSAQFNVGGGVTTTNGATITNTSILLGNSSVNTEISPSTMIIRTNATGNAYSQLILASSDQAGGSLALQHGNTTSNSTILLGAQSGNYAAIELGGSTAAFIDFKTPSEDDFDTRLISDASGFSIIAGSSTSANIVSIKDANVIIDSGTLFVDAVNNRVGINNTAPGVALRVTGAADISSTANIQSNANVGGTLGVSGVATLSANLVVDATTLFVDAVNNRVGIRNSAPVNALTVNGIVDSTGSIYIAKTAADNGVTAGIELQSQGTGYFTRSAATPLILNRLTDDGTIVAFQQAGTTEGSISIAGTTTTYGAFCGAHWSQLSDNSRPNILRGTVVETIDEMCEWQNEDNDQLPKFKISDTVASKLVYGVFQTWDNDDDVNNDANIASLGAYVIRVDAGVTVSTGDLLESAGNGCARVQSDDIIRSSTIGKVTNGSHVIETYEDGSYLVPCVLYCG